MKKEKNITSLLSFMATQDAHRQVLLLHAVAVSILKVKKVLVKVKKIVRSVSWV